MKTAFLSGLVLAVVSLNTSVLAQPVGGPQCPMAKGGNCGCMAGAQAADPHASHGMIKGDRSPSSMAFADVNAKMHKAMDITFTGQADLDFLKGMIPHHQGAVDMAKVVLEHGKDDATKTLAKDIIVAQEKEIQWMRQRITELEAKR